VAGSWLVFVRVACGLKNSIFYKGNTLTFSRYYLTETFELVQIAQGGCTTPPGTAAHRPRALDLTLTLL
jgi:hypothetical protein